MEDTIAAIATAPGEGGIGIIRVSGENALPAVEKVFQGKPLENRKLRYGHICDNITGQTIDEVMAVYMKGPHSYTAEDVVEIQCHGSVVALRKILTLLLHNGIRLAEPGEFTKRAFLNGRLDLSQAEAVIDLVRAKTDKTFDVALHQLDGQFSQEISAIRSQLMDLLVNLTVNIDYPDEDIEELTYERLTEGLRRAAERIDSLLSTAGSGRILREGLRIAIIGKPNVGKSSLMNALLGESRAIVTEIPGTTRDVIEEAVSIRSIPVKLTDTAGIRHTEDLIEKIGIEKSKASFNEADLIFFVVDGSRPLEEEDREIMEYIGRRKTIVIINKTDLPQQLALQEIKDSLPEAYFIETAVKKGLGLELIQDKVEELVYGGQVKQETSVMVTNVRHKDLLEQAHQALQDAENMARAAEPLELVEIDVNQAYVLLGEIIGEAVSDDIINEVFSRFCLGK